MSAAVRTAVRTTVRTVGLALLLVVGAGCGAVDGVTGAREPEAVVRDLPGVAEVERSYDVQEEDFYVNVVTADLEPDVTAEQIADVMDAMAPFREREEPVSLVLYLDEGTADWEPTAAGSGRNGIWGYGDGLAALERAEALLAGAALLEPLDELEGGDPSVALDGDALLVAAAPEREGTNYVSPGEEDDARLRADLVSQAADLVLADTRLAAHEEIGISAPDFRLSADDGLADVLPLWETVRSTLEPAGGAVRLDSLSLHAQGSDSGSAPLSVDACVELPEPPSRRDLTVDALGEQIGSVVRAVGDVLDEPGTYVEVSVRSRLDPRSTTCLPILRHEVGRGPVRPQGLDPAWSELAFGTDR